MAKDKKNNVQKAYVYISQSGMVAGWLQAIKGRMMFFSI